uniref:sulfurtransferase n=1 Tax=Leucobacter soli TaxID=2812850 RepID=UPI0038B26827
MPDAAVSDAAVSRGTAAHRSDRVDRDALLIDPAGLQALLRAEARLPPGAPRTRVLDVRWTLAQPDGRPAYREGHLPGAVYVDLDTELSMHGPATAGRHPLPDGDTLTAAARRWGLRPGDAVVAYDGGGNFAAARLWWLLRDAGVDRVRLLDGALPAWVTAGLPLEQGDADPAPGTVELRPGRLPRIELEDAAAFALEHLLLDVRATERYAGRQEPIDPRAGHIPGARNLPTGGNLDDDGWFLPVEELRRRFATAGTKPGTETGEEHGPGTRIGAYCGSGITASHTVFALALAGREGALFPGSWSQWANHPELPVATGEAP